MSESGDRRAFTARLRARLGHGVPELAHPMPPPLAEVPVVQSCALDPDDLIGSFVANARTAAAVVHDLDADDVPDELLDQIVRRHDVRRAVIAREPEAQALGERLRARGVAVDPLSTHAAARADLGITGAVHGLATTGTVVVDSTVSGGRSASLLPPTHLCVLAASRIVASTAEVLRGMRCDQLPANLVFITGPSRSGDIEQIITLGVHGPLTVEIAVLRSA